MKHCLVSLFLLLIQFTIAQESSVLIARQLIERGHDKVKLSSITYLSDELKVNGYSLKPEEEGNYPCIIFNRGGNREFGSYNMKMIQYLLVPLAEAGYVVIASQYRGNGGSEGQEEFGERM